MLIEFSVANFRSYSEEQVLSLMKAKGDELETTNTFEVKTGATSFKLLRSAAIYGPNASGKSNLLRAVQTMRQLVLESASYQHGKPLPVTPFVFSSSKISEPSEFEATFIVDNVRYQYGFSASSDKIYGEWLFAHPKGRPQRWFTREWLKEEGDYKWEFGNNLSGEKQVWQKATRSNALFLSTAVQLNSEQLQPVFDWFRNTLHISSPNGWRPGFSARMCDQDYKPKILEFLAAADIYIDDIMIKEKQFDSAELPADLPDFIIREAYARQLKDTKLIEISMVHKDEKGNSVPLAFSDESDGTQRLFSYAGPWIDSLNNGSVFFVDELHAHLHPKLVRFLVALFNNPVTNPNNAQLIFTTHETSVLSQEIFRRDQIWFCEKNKTQATEFYPLTDFSPRKERENLELAYLSGRYGALPFVNKMQQTTKG